jgi:hypothetical protein
MGQFNVIPRTPYFYMGSLTSVPRTIMKQAPYVVSHRVIAVTIVDFATLTGALILPNGEL